MNNAKRTATNKHISAPQWYHINEVKARLLLVIACIVCYGNTAFNNYSLDDDFAVTQNVFIQKGVAGIPDLLTHPYATTQDKSMDFRPVNGISFALEHQFFGSNPHISHFINVLLFACAVLLLFSVLTTVFRLQTFHPFLPFLVALFYVIHPAHTEIISSIKNRDEILSLIFMLLVFLYVFKFFSIPRHKIIYGTGVFFFLLLSLTSKLTSLPFLAVIILTMYYYGYQKEKKEFYIFFSVVLIFAVTYFGLIIYNLKRPMYDLENPLINNHDLSIRLGTAFEVLIHYFKFMLWPFPFRFYYGFNVIPLIPLSDSLAVLSLMLHLFLFFYGVSLFFRKKIAGLFILGYLSGIFLYSNLIIIYPGIVSERALFFPSLCFIAAAVIFVYEVFRSQEIKEVFTFTQKFIIVLGMLLVATYTWLTIQRNFQWKNTLTLMSSDIGNLSSSALANYFYASNLQGEAEASKSDSLRYHYLAEAKKYYKHTIKVAPLYSEAYFKLGMLYEYEELAYDSAFEYFAKAYPLDTTKTTSQFQLAKLYFMRGNLSESDKLFNNLYAKIPQDTFTLFFYARVKNALGDTLKALTLNQELLNLTPDSYYAYWNKALFLQQANRFSEAVPFYELAIKYGLRDREIINMLINYYSDNGQQEKISEINTLISN